MNDRDLPAIGQSRITASECFWLAPAMTALRRAHDTGRIGAALLIHADPGCGGEVLAEWTTQLLLCRHKPAPCMECADCRNCAAHQHPDVFALHPTGDSKQIRVEDTRAFLADLVLTSHGGGYRIGIVTPADVLNPNAANALLKTLEEPPPSTLIALISTSPSRLPATILSRCTRLRVTAPARAATLAWLTARGHPGDLASAAAVLGDAPLTLLEAQADAVAHMAAETERAVEEVARGAGEPAQLAERWSRDEFALRLACLEAWLTERIHLSATAPNGNIAWHFGLLDALRELRREIDTPLNKSVALETWLWRLAAGGQPGRVTRSQREAADFG